MTYLIALLFAGCIAGLTIALAQMAPTRPAAVSRRLEELADLGSNPFEANRRRERQSRIKQLEGVLQSIGNRADIRKLDAGVRAQLIHAGFRGPDAARIYIGARIFFPIGLFALFLVLAPLFGKQMILFGFMFAIIGWIGPVFYVGGKARRRQKDLQKALPDTLDSLVVCVEAGLGLNQAIIRVADEIRFISVLMSDELTLMTLEIRAGTPREDALRNLADRTGLADLRSLVTILIQTDRFGTSISQALRVQSDTLREKRKQRAEEAAAKTSIKMLFPLIFFIFPAMFVITLGPAVVKLISNWGNSPV